MHRVAEDGIAAHWKYKEGRIGANTDEQYFAWLRQLLEWHQEVRDPREFIHSLKVDLYPEEVYTFTPRGEVKALPRGATPVDFAYSIHTDVGHTCVGARINGRMVPLRTQLQSGDIVEIVTAGAHKPSRDWLNFVVTTRARNKIKHFINAEEKLRAVELGRRLLEKEVRRVDLSPKTVLDAEQLDRIANDFASKKGDDLLAAVGYGKVSLHRVLERLVPQERLRRRSGPTAIASVVRRVFRSREQKLKDQGLRRLHGLPRAVLHADPGREDRGLRDAGQGRLGPLGDVPQRAQPAVRPRAAHRRRMGQGRRHQRVHRGVDHSGGGPPRHSRRRDLLHRGREHQHEEGRGLGERQPPRPDSA